MNNSAHLEIQSIHIQTLMFSSWPLQCKPFPLHSQPGVWSWILWWIFSHCPKCLEEFRQVLLFHLVKLFSFQHLASHCTVLSSEQWETNHIPTIFPFSILECPKALFLHLLSFSHINDLFPVNRNQTHMQIASVLKAISTNALLNKPPSTP